MGDAAGSTPSRTQDARFWREVEEAFSAVIEAGDSARTAALERHCAGRRELRAHVETLLAAHARAGDFLTPDSVPAGEQAAAPLPIPKRVGAFELRERIGEGGMGAVYRGERVEGGFEQQVAVKLIASRLYGAETLRRFRAEQQILASLQHPNIVGLLDGGVTAEGHPYIVMEHVQGAPLTRYCRERRLGLRERLTLFQQLCAAVSYAHRHLVVHRDLKPANVLVTPEGTAKVLDFGVAKLLEPQQRSADATAALLGPLTPDYASPEQLRGRPVTTACDVYSLGVMLYEIVSGNRPYVTAGKQLDEILETVLRAEPPRPSTSAGVDLPYDTRRIRGDLDAIIASAMAKDPERRYASAEELSEELARMLAGLTVTARADTLGYRLSRFVGRHRPAVAIATLLVLSLVGGLGATLRQARISERERQRAEQQSRDTRELANALLFEIHDLIRVLPGANTAREALLATALKYLERLAAQTRTDQRLAHEAAAAYERIAEIQENPAGSGSAGVAPSARASLLKALALRREIARSTPDDPGNRLALSEIQGRLSAGSLRASSADEARRWAESSLRELEPAGVGANRELLLARVAAETRLYAACAETADVACAGQALEQALQLRGVLLKRFPDDILVRSQMADSLRSHALAVAEKETWKPPADGSTVIQRSWKPYVVFPDIDGDGWNANGDCVDSNPAIHPGAFEEFGNGLDDDCSPGTLDAGIPGFDRVETLKVPLSQGSAATSRTRLLRGVTYRLRASGTAPVGGPGFADAEYAFKVTNECVIDQCGRCRPSNPSETDLGIGVNDSDQVRFGRKSPFWGEFNPDHVYTIDFAGLGSPIKLDYHDCSFGDNFGYLKVEIFAPSRRSPQTSAAPARPGR